MTLAELVYHLLETREAEKDGELWTQCPFCQDEKWRMGINVNTGQAHCFRASCDWKTSDKRYLFKSLCELFRVEERFEADGDVDVEKKKTKKESTSATQLPKEFEPLWRDVDDEIGKMALTYLLSRGVTKGQIKKKMIGFCAVGKYSWRIVFPVIYREKRLKGFVGRDFSGKSELRYLNSGGDKTLYNVPRKKKKVAVLLEGIIDALAVERAAPYFDALGRLGSSLTDAQVSILMDYEEVVIWPDPDAAGVEGCVKVYQALQDMKPLPLPKVSVVLPIDPETEDDPGKLGETDEGLQEIKTRLKNRTKWSENLPMLMRNRVV